MKKIIVGGVILFALFSCTNDIQIEDNQAGVTKIIAADEKVKVTTSIVPLASIANYIGGESVEVNNIVPIGSSPHGFSLTPQNLINIQKSDIVFLLGIQDIDGFLFKSLSGTKSIALDVGLQVLDATSEHDHSDHEEGEEDHEEHHEEGEEDHEEHHEEGEEDHEEHHEDENEQGGESVSPYLAAEGEGHVHAEASIDPHVWTGEVNSLIIAKKIQEELTKLQPSQAATFEINYKRFEAEITTAFDDFMTLVEGKTQKEFIVFHDAYNYLLFDAGIDSEKKLIFRSNVMSDPGSADMKELTDEVELHGITVFFVEPQFESKALNLFAQENNGEIFELDPLGSSIESDGFLNNIRTNLETLSHIYE